MRDNGPQFFQCYPEDFIPGDPGQSPIHQKPMGREGDRTCRHDRETSHFNQKTRELVINFVTDPVDVRRVNKLLELAREKHGEVKSIVVYLCQDALFEDGSYLRSQGFEQEQNTDQLSLQFRMVQRPAKPLKMPDPEPEQKSFDRWMRIKAGL
jgi:hypothetical protein